MPQTEVSTPVLGLGVAMVRIMIPQGSGWATLFASSDSFSPYRPSLATIHRPTLQTTDRRTQHRATSATFSAVANKMFDFYFSGHTEIVLIWRFDVRD